MKYRTSIAALLLLAGLSSAQAQTGVSLRDAVRHALQDNTDVKKQNLAILQSRQRLQEVNGQGLPQISGTGQLVDNLLLPQTMLPGDILGQPGTTIPMKMGVQYNIPFAVRADQMLYNQAWIVARQQAKAGGELADAQAGKTRQDVAYNTATAYYQALILREQADLVRANLHQVEQSLSAVRSQYENQMARKIDLDQLQVTYANTSTDLQNTQVQFAYALDNLKLLMGYPIGDTLVLSEPIDEVSLPAPANTVANNPKVALLDAQELAKVLEIKSIKAKYLPSLAAFGSYGYQSQFSDWDNMPWSSNAAIGLQLSVPLFDGLQKHRQVKQRALELDAIRLDRTLLDNTLNVEYRNAVQRYTQNQRTVANQEANLELANSVYAAVQNNFRNGLASLSDLITSDTARKEARSQYLTALLQARIALLDILYVNGGMEELGN
jgi:outer membrane protein TolC